MFEPGTQIGRYEIQRRLGRGGMGSVYAAHDPVLGRLVGIKVFAGELDFPDARERFEREARSAAALAHPHIVAVYDFGEYQSQPYIVMEYVPGETLAEVIRRKAPVPFSEKLRWIEELTAGAGYAHHMSVVHRDIKPANLIIDRTGRLKILDFGIARMLGIASNTRDMIGTPGYMAPEQILGAAVDRRADLFSIGVVFYELLAYTEAFRGETLPTITHRILTEDPVPLSRLVPDLNPAVLPIIERCLKKKPEERFDDAESLRVAISRIRRRFEDDAAGAAPTILRRDTPPQRPIGRPGTGSVRRPLRDAVGVATPPPNDPNAQARLIAAKLEAALAQARSLLLQGDLESAYESCRQALAFDAQHHGALELEAQITTAFELRQSEELDEEYLESQSPDDPENEIPAQLESDAGVEYAPTVLAPPRGAPAIARSTSVPQSAPLPSPPARPSRKTVPPAKPPAVKAKPPGPSLLTRARTATRSIAAPLRAALPLMAARVGAAGTAVTARARAIVPTRLPRLAPVEAGSKRRLVWAGIAAVGVVAVIVAALVLIPAAIPQTGVLVIEAVPWATITAIESEGGEQQPLPSPASTPALLTLPAGTYQVLVTGPPPESEAQRITVTVAANAGTVAPTIRFRTVTPEEYFEQYLAAPTAPVDPSTPSPDATSTTTPAALTPGSPAPPQSTAAGTPAPAAPVAPATNAPPVPVSGARK
jgi:serine/threonine protein kinase